MNLSRAARLFLICLGCALVGSSATVALPDEPASAPVRLRVLFIGNSLTASNDLPAMVQAMARVHGVEFEYEACTPGGASLEDHWGDGHCRKLLDDQPWDFVVLQQGPSSRADSRANLKEWSARWADAIRARGARPALYMVWPQRGQKDGFLRVSDSYRLAADACGALLLPAGDAWRTATEQDERVQLYSHDRLHPTEQGTYLAALVIARETCGVDVQSVPDRLELSSGGRIVIDRRTANVLRTAAQHATGPATRPSRP